MKLDPDRLADTLKAELGANSIQRRAELSSAYVVDGKAPALICRPESADGISAALRICIEADAAVMPWGGGTAMRIGNPPRRLDVILDLAKLDRIIEHDHANLTATVQAGLRVAALQKALATHRQFLSLDPPYPECATVGGTLAANLNGPRRSCYGSARDLVIGTKAVLPTGEQIKAGGKVVKNVAGYDMNKLFVGSLGTLGVITEATLRMTPLPETAATAAAYGNLTQLLELAGELSHSTLLPAAVVLANDRATAVGTRQNGWRLAVRCEGFESTVARHLRDMTAMAHTHGLQVDSFDDASHQALWEEIRDFPLRADMLVFRVVAPRASATELLNTVESWNSADLSLSIVADVTAGVLWIAAAENDRAADQFTKLTSLCARNNGHAVMFAAPAHLKRDIDIWGAPPPALFLMRKIKDQFDPHRLMNPGRFVDHL